MSGGFRTCCDDGMRRFGNGNHATPKAAAHLLRRRLDLT
jgi:hypothetical protein